VALTAAEIVDARRFLGYSVSGDTDSFPYRELVYSNVSYFGLSIDYRLQHLSPEEEAVTRTKFLVPLNKREDEIQCAASRLQTDTAAVWKRNPNEVSDRRGLFNQLRYDLCTFLGFKPGPQLAMTNRLVRA
jgi:hypothetical protein